MIRKLAWWPAILVQRCGHAGDGVLYFTDEVVPVIMSWPEFRVDMTLWFHPSWLSDATPNEILAADALAQNHWPDAHYIVVNGHGVGIRMIVGDEMLVADVLSRSRKFREALTAVRP